MVIKMKSKKDISFIVGVTAIIAIHICLVILIIMFITSPPRYKILDKKYIEKEIVINEEEGIITKEVSLPHYFIQIEKNKETKEWIEVNAKIWYKYNIFDYYYE